MSVLLYPPFTAESNIASNANITSTKINNIKAPIEDFIEVLADLTENEWDTTNNGDPVPVESVMNTLDATSGDFSLSLPSIASLNPNYKYTYTFKNLTSNGNQPTLNTSGGNGIQTPSETTATPTSTSYIFNIFNEVVTFTPNFTNSTWGILYRYANFGRYRAKVYRVSGQNLTASTPTIVQYTDKVYDYNNNFDTSNYRYTVPFDGTLQVSGVLGNFSSSNRTVSMTVLINSFVKIIFSQDFVSANQDYQQSVSARFNVQKGDLVQIRASTSADSNVRAIEETNAMCFDMIDDMY
jgi:hypothetical protein